MPNWCSNYVCFRGAETDITALKNRIRERIALSNDLGQGVMIHGLTPEQEKSGRFFFDLYINEDGDPNDVSIQYESKWVPNPDELIEACKEFNVRAYLEYEESGNCVFGKAIIDGSGIVKEDVVPHSVLTAIEYVEADEEKNEPDYYIHRPSGKTAHNEEALIHDVYTFKFDMLDPAFQYKDEDGN